MLELFDEYAYTLILMLDTGTMLLILTKAFPFKNHIKRHGLIFFLFWFISNAFIITLMHFFKINIFFCFALALICVLLYSAIFLKKEFYLKAVTCMFFLICIILLHVTLQTASILFFKSPIPTFLPYRMLWTIFRAVPTALMAVFFTIYASKINFNIPSNYKGIFLFTVAFCFIGTMHLTVGGPVSGAAFVIIKLAPYLCFLFSMLLLYYIFIKLITEYEEKNKFQLYSHQVTLQKMHLLETAGLYKNIQSTRHELKNHILCMNILLKKKQYEELEEYLGNIYRQEYDIEMIDSGNDFISIILNQKLSYARSKNIPLAIQSHLPADLDLDPGPYCAVISNLLDNAIEACTPIQNPQILLTVKQEKGYIFIICKNTVDHDVLEVNPHLKTTKKNKEKHGLGLQVIRQVVESSDGSIDFSVEDGMFTVKIMIRINSATNIL